MARLSEQEINQIRAKADIVDVVGRYVPLTRKGRNYVAQCPFHDDHDPSMSVNADKQIFKCFEMCIRDSCYPFRYQCSLLLISQK